MSKSNPQIAAVRAFNRFYTRQIGVLDAGHLQTRFSLGEARLIYEVASRGTTTATELVRATSVDPGQVSRMLARLKQDGFLETSPNAGDRRQSDISLTHEGEIAFVGLDAASNEVVARMLAEVDPGRRAALVDAMTVIRNVLGDAVPEAPVTLRPYRVGDLGWLIHRQGLLYNQQFGWNGAFEALIAGLYREFAEAPDSPPKALWVAERNQVIAGSVFVLPAAGHDATAQLRMLYVEPEARGQGLGRLLVDQVVSFSRESGYRRVRLWTQSVLQSARRIYAGAGFELVESKPHHSFGKDLVGEIWELELQR